ncbi:chromate transporter [Ammoniphilus sp. YIM 78166]|uniref:chromate transporter n=1 Tax=Ammoniphilus sp. YIM 78166 TaxID=1644106 RepID=UPI001F0EA213|nr:chromate transporter [Ammoniphilus sp. YIM 78166]
MIWKIFCTFFMLGPATFGGGYAMIPLLERAIIEKNRWMKKEEVTDVLAVSQTAPGSVAVNAATFIGYRLAGPWGALAATVGIILPTFIIILILTTLFLSVQHSPLVQAAFLGIRPAIVALILYAAYRTAKTSILDKTTAAVAGIVLLILLLSSIHPMFVILFGGLIGALFFKKEPPENKRKLDLDYYMGAGI